MKKIFPRCLGLLTTTFLVWPALFSNQSALAEQNVPVFVSTLLSRSSTSSINLTAREHYLYVSSATDINIRFQSDQPHPIFLQLDKDLVNQDGVVLIPANTANIMAHIRLSGGTAQIIAEKILIEGIEMSIEASSEPVPAQIRETRSEAEKMNHFLAYATPIGRASGAFLFEDQQVGEFVSGAVPFILGALFIDADVEQTIQLPANQSIPLKLNMPISLPADIAYTVHGESFFSVRPTP